MAGIRFSIIKSLNCCAKPSLRNQCFRSDDSHIKFTRPISGFWTGESLFACANHSYHTLQQCEPQLKNPSYRTAHVCTPPLLSPNLYLKRDAAFLYGASTLNYRSYTSFFGGKPDKSALLEVPDASGASNPNSDGSVIPSDWVNNVKDAWRSMIDAAVYTGERAKDVSNEMTPHVQQLFNSHPYLGTVIVPIGCTFAATILAWAVMPRFLRRFHKYTTHGTTALLTMGLLGDQIPYEKSMWGAIEDPARYLITFMAFSQIGMMIAPTTIASAYIGQAWRGAAALSFVWFLHRWKTNVFSRALATQSIAKSDRQKLLTLDKVSSVGLFALGLMALAEACGVAVQSILTVGGIGGVATAFAARDILGNVLSGLSMQFSQPFSLGDVIKAGSIEGQVVEMGLTSTSLLNAEKFPVIVPNSLFSSQVIVNKSRAQWCAMVSKIPLQVDNLEKIPLISDEIKNMLKSNSKVFLGKEAPYCFLSRIESTHAELTLGCNLNAMSKDEWYSAEQDILIQAVLIIKQHGARLGSTLQDLTSQ